MSPAGLPHPDGSKTGKREPTRHNPAPAKPLKERGFTCPCGLMKWITTCGTCGAPYCKADGHAKHVCEVR